ncbi:polysaccharide biosynthesis protein [Alkalilimnicola ehrlichii]|uniref:polysaccharide biosynthesis protein n=1 Tax=Alkalilimnicola ehrlichii TaxID=351052 RepID=UPI003BA22A3C
MNKAFLIDLPRPVKRFVMIMADTLMLPVALWAAFSLRLGTPVPGVLLDYGWLLLLVPAVSLPVFALFGLYRAVVRYMGLQAIIAVVQGVTLSALVFGALVMLGRLEGIPRSALLIYWLLALFMVGGSRLVVRAWFQAAIKRRGTEKPVVIYGAGTGGIGLATSLFNGRQYRPVAFVDDNPAKQGTVIAGLPVRKPAELAELIDRNRLEYILLAMPRLSRTRRREIVAQLEPLPAHILTIPSLADIVANRASPDEVREVEVEDLLGRDAVGPRRELLARCIRGKTVMVTGAGGSIGSELCRQILREQPTQLVLVERSEFALYAIERELQAQLQGEARRPAVQAVLANVTDLARMEMLMHAFRVDTVYHAAAYKHVPLVETNVLEGIDNNVFGTLHTALAAVEAGVRYFVLVSTDKAVRPTNVMGASKRLAELVLQGLARQPDIRTRFSMVRFGNVLGSSGSVVPLFREQIRNGGPITVTHPEVTRYFMTIPEAASLVLQAGSMAHGGEVFVLDMGEPVRIVDLARRMIRLSGLEERNAEHPDGDIEIHFTGLRPGEKLYEELLLGEAVTETSHPMIMRAREGHLPTDTLQSLLSELRAACRRYNTQDARKLMAQVVEGYEAAGPNCDVLGRQLNESADAVARGLFRDGEGPCPIRRAYQRGTTPISAPQSEAPLSKR